MTRAVRFLASRRHRLLTLAGPQFRPRRPVEYLGGGGTFQMHRLLFAAAAIAAIAALAASRMDGQQIRVIDDSAHRQCAANGYIPGTPLYLQCRAQVVQPGIVKHREAVAQ
jgi:hypothetical protein